MTLNASLAGHALNGIVLVNEWTGNFSVACNTGLLVALEADCRNLSWGPRIGIAFSACTLRMDLVTVATHHAAFGHGMVEVHAEPVELLSVTGSAEGGLVGFQHLARLSCGWEDRAPRCFPGSVERFRVSVLMD